jgi:hypothetical protein
VQVLAAAPDVVNAMRELPAAYDNSVISIADLPAERARLAKYYIGDFMQEFEKRNTGRKLDMASTVAQLPDLAMNLQYQYIAANQNPLGAKNSLDKANDGSRYSELHGALHPFLRTALRQFGLYDIFLVDPRNGNIVYTVFKELDFATSLVSGPYTKTRLGDAFRQSWALEPPGQVALSEFGEYLPSYNDQGRVPRHPHLRQRQEDRRAHRPGAHRQDQLGDDRRRPVERARHGRHRRDLPGVRRRRHAALDRAPGRGRHPGLRKSIGDAGFARAWSTPITTKGTGIGLVPIKTQATRKRSRKAPRASACIPTTPTCRCSAPTRRCRCWACAGPSLPRSTPTRPSRRSPCCATRCSSGRWASSPACWSSAC